MGWITRTSDEVPRPGRPIALHESRCENGTTTLLPLLPLRYVLPQGGATKGSGSPFRQGVRPPFRAGSQTQPLFTSPGDDPMIGEEVTSPASEADQLREQLLRAQRLSSVGTLASSVAHEFNNILTTIMNYAKLGLRAETGEAARLQALDKILKGSQRAASVISSMLGFARNQSTQRERTDIASLVEEVLVLTGKDLSKHQIKVETKLHARPQAPVIRGQIEQILLNLIINARQAMPRGGFLRLEARANKRPHNVEIPIADTGDSPPPVQLQRIFVPF